MNKTQRCSRGMVLAVAAVAIMVCGTVAQADIMYFDNPPGPGHYHWPQALPIVEYLDITLAASAQPAPGSGSGRFSHPFDASQGCSDVGAGGTGHVQTGGVHAAALAAFDAGETIPGAFGWTGSGIVIHPAIGSNFPEGEEKYIGVRFDLGSGWQYGWIGVVRGGTSVPGLEEYELDTFAWGYETTPGAYIEAGAVPEPGSLALLALGACAALRRRR